MTYTVPLVKERPPAAPVARGARLPRRQGDHARGRQGRGQERDAGEAGRRLSQGPARPAAVHVPGLRLAARRPAHAPHGDDPLGLGLLRLRPDLHLAFLRCQADGGLRAVRLRDAGHRPAVRGHPQRRVRSGQARRLRRRGHHQSLRAHGLGRAARPAAARDRGRAHHRHRRAGLRCADPCRGQGRAGRRHAPLCAPRGRAGARAAAAPGAGRRAPGHPDRRAVPADPVGVGALLKPMGLAVAPQVPSANGATSTPHSTA